jgi:hypothetical protein
MVCRNKDLIGADHLSKSLQEHNLIKLARSAGVSLSKAEEYVLQWVTEVLIWKARYSVPTRTKYAQHFFHKLDDVRLKRTSRCIKILDGVFARAKKTMPQRGRRVKFDVLVDTTRAGQGEHSTAYGADGRAQGEIPAMAQGTALASISGCSSEAGCCSPAVLPWQKRRSGG